MELFDQVRAAPPPDRIRDTKPVVQTENGSDDGIAEDDDDTLKDISMPSPVAVTPSPDFTLHNKKANAETIEEVKLSGSAKRKFSNDDGKEKDESGVKPTTDMDTKEINDEPEAQTDIQLDGDNQLQQQQQLQLLSPPKTKAEQKMFIDHDHHQPEATVSIPTTSVSAIRPCHVRVKRLTQKEISLHTAGSRRGSQRKRVRKSDQSAASTDPDTDSPSPGKKAKLSNKIHIKVPWLQNGAKQRNLQKLAREHTPPPSKLNRKAKGKNSPSGAKNRPMVSAGLIKRYGARYFGCVVKVKRTPMPPWPVHDVSFSLNNSNASSKRRSKKLNLSVSFSEAVEIFGSSETGTRRSTLGSGRSPRKGCVTVPTRLQRVDATGNILEDIALTSNAMLFGPSPAKRGRRSGGAIEESVKATCNGDGSLSRKLKRSSQRVPVAGLASLRLEDTSKAADEDDNGADDDEYIVPNELPGIHRAGTPIATPIKRKITVTTTTISDDDDNDDDRMEDEKEPEKAQENTEKEKPEKELIKEINENDTLKDDEQIKRELEELIKEQKQTKKEQDEKKELTEEQSEDTKDKEILHSSSSSEKEETTNIITETETENITEKENETLKDAADIKESKETSQMELRVEEEETLADEGENNMEPLLVSQTDISTNQETDDNDKQDEPKEDKEPQAAEDEDVEKKIKIDKTLKSSPLLGITTSTISVSKTEDPEDILEIATSLDDVRDLHTPLSPNSRCSTPQDDKKIVEQQLPIRSRLDSGDSESSFKSATEATDATNIDNPATNNETTTTTITTTTEATITTIPTIKGESLSGDTDSISTTPFPAIGEIPSLNDEVLEELAEPDFQLNNSRHTISTGTLDDIMTALES
ncbi:uncharacterized protein Dwil_GK19943 [Drosophila willistoni]|uniref:Uncharacterized protein n=1 Tax=Drosophila willistoni TaxID=7260 RepID=B4MSC2_DROWI|nr:uncharacterized protein Dwil_GK19943 [Drosophila willistoni]